MPAVIILGIGVIEGHALMLIVQLCLTTN